MKKVLFTRSPTGEPFKLAYNIDDTAEVFDALAQQLITEGFAVELKRLVQETKEPAAPKSEKATRRISKKETATKK